MSTQTHPIGRVVATESNPTTTGQVRFWLEPAVQLKPFDFVRVTPPETHRVEIGDFYAMIYEIQQVSDEPSALTGFISSDFGHSEIPPRVSRVVTTYADATVLYNTKGIEMPIPHGSQVHWPDEKGVQIALGILDFDRHIPAGYIAMSGPEQTTLTINVQLDSNYLIGPEGAHLNISGISGLATKTSYAMFLLTAIQQQERLLVEKTELAASDRSAFLIFNVKGSDLLHLHERANEVSDQTNQEWNRCDLNPDPLSDIVYFYPFANYGSCAQTKLSDDEVAANIKARTAYRYYYDVENALDRLGLLMEDILDPNQTLTSCTDYCMDNIEKNKTWKSFRNDLQNWATDTPNKNIPVVAWRRFNRLFGQRTRNQMFTEESRDHDRLMQVPMAEILSHLRPGQVVVVDIAQLPDYLQGFVVGDVLDLIRQAKIAGPTRSNDDAGASTLAQTVILFADELNKFAPAHGQQRSITAHLREISERGRSEGIVLFGAEQFRTGVDKHVTGNSSTFVFGRTTAAEANRDPEIKGLPGSQSKRAPFLAKGELLVSHTRFSSGTLKLRFPRNVYRQV